MSAVVVKLTRVVLLAPLVVAVGVVTRRGQAVRPGIDRPSLLPPFVAGFLAMIAVRSLGLVPAAWLASLQTID